MIQGPWWWLIIAAACLGFGWVIGKAIASWILDLMTSLVID